MTALFFPPALLPSSVTFHPESLSRSGGRSLTGSEQVVSSGAGRWRASMTFAIKGAASVQSYRAMLAALQGRTNTILVSPFDPYRPTDANGRRLSIVAAASLDGDYLFDQTGFGQDDETVIASVNAGAALRATELAMDLVDIEGPRPGQYFGIGEHLYIVTAAWQEAPADPLSVRFWPPLREAVYAADRIILDRPVCRMRLASDDGGELAVERLLNTVLTTSLDFTEAF